MRPFDRARPVVDGFGHRLRPSAAIGASPALRVGAGIENVEHAERARGVHVEQAGLRAHARRRPVGRALAVGRDERTVFLRHLRRVRASAALVRRSPASSSSSRTPSRSAAVPWHRSSTKKMTVPRRLRHEACAAGRRSRCRSAPRSRSRPNRACRAASAGSTTPSFRCRD